jgi:hypothetical protein
MCLAWSAVLGNSVSRTPKRFSDWWKILIISVRVDILSDKFSNQAALEAAGGG